MKLHVQCDRCKKYAEGTQMHPGWRVQSPDGWHHLQAFAEPILINEYFPDGPIRLLLCPECAPVVEKAIRAAVGS